MFRNLFLPVAAILLLTSCHRVPKHARYIPKDAFAVLGIHTDELRKELAWSAITGSGLLDELRKSGNGGQAPAAVKDLEQSGIDFGSTLYAYAKPDTRFAGSMKLAAVLPLEDAGKVMDYLRGHFPQAAMSKVEGRNQAFIFGKAVLGWNDDVLIVMNPMVRKVAHNEEAHTDTLGGMAIDGEPYSWTEEVPDEAASMQELAAAFRPVKSSGIDDVSRFAELEKAGHDITFWMSYDALMDMYNSQLGDAAGLGMLGMSMGNTLFKGSAMAAGYDFERGEIKGLMRYYASDSMRPVAKEFGREPVDGDMLRRLPTPGLNMAAGFHLSPAAIKLMLEKMNLSGMANLALMSQGLTLDDVLGGFSGDMVMAVNNFHMTQETDTALTDDFPQQSQMTIGSHMDFVFALKIGDRGKLMKLVSLAGGANLMRQTAPNTYIFSGMNEGTLVLGDKYIAVSTKATEAQAFLRERGGAMPDAVHSEVSGHPIGAWADLRSIIAAGVTGGTQDSSVAIVRKTFTTASMNGGEFKDGANEYRLKLLFTDKNESSLLQLLRMAQRLAALHNRARPAISMR